MSQPRYLHFLAWSAVVGAFVVPVWFYPYIPTQDGPAHVQNAVILRDLLRGDARLEQFYWINWRPLPNWTCFALLAGLSWLFPPLIAEKLLVTLYVAGFAGAYRYFASSLSGDAGLLSLAGFLLVFNRCFWMGFYNYCLGVVLFFVLLGYLLRRWDGFGPQQALALCGLLLLSYFTHLFAFLLAAGSCLWLAASISPRNWRKLLYVGSATAPGLLLTLGFFREGQYAGSGFFARLHEYLAGWLSGHDQWERLTADVWNLEKELFGIYLDLPLTLGMGLVLLYEIFLLAACFADEAIARNKGRRRSLAALGLVLALLYFVVPDFLVFGKGGFWKARLVLLPPLLWLACVRLPDSHAVKYALAAATLLLLAVNLGLVTTFTQSCCEELGELTSGVEAAGRDRVLLSEISGGRRGAVNPLRHGGSYYCLDSGNIELSRHFATVAHSPVRLRPGLQEAEQNAGNYPLLSLVDTIVLWSDDPTPLVPEGVQLLFRNNRLKVLRRTEPTAPANDGG